MQWDGKEAETEWILLQVFLQPHALHSAEDHKLL